MPPSIRRVLRGNKVVTHCTSSISNCSSSSDTTAATNEVVVTTIPMSVIGDDGGGGDGDGSDIHNWTVADDRFRKILQFYGEDAHRPENYQACQVVKQLSPQEQDEAANCSYAYWHLSCKFRFRDRNNNKKKKKNSNNKSDGGGDSFDSRKLRTEWRFGAAVREAIRHLEGVESVEDAVKLLKATLKFHTDNQTWHYRCCIQMMDGVTVDDMMMIDPDDDKTGSTVSTSTLEKMEQRKSRICNEMTTVQPFVTRGHDRDFRSIIFAFPRNATGEEESFIDSILYTMERAVACTEFQSHGRQDKVLTVMDSQGSTSPSMKACKAAVNILQQYYPGRLKNMIILNPSYMLLGIYKMTKPFMDPETSAKFIVVKGVKHTEMEMSKLMDASQAMPILIPTGHLQSEVDVHTFLHHRPFFCLYDDDGKKYSRPLVATDSAPTIDVRPSNVTTSSTQSTRGNKISTVAATRSQKDSKKSSSTTTTTTTTTSTVTTIAQSECSNLVSVRSLAVGELLMTDRTGKDDEDLLPRVVIVRA